MIARTYVRAPSERIKPALMFIGDCMSRPTLFNKSRRVVQKRWAVMVILRDEGWSTTDIARYLGLNDHSTVIYGLRQAQHEPAVQDLVAQARQMTQPPRDARFMEWMRRYAAACVAKGERIFNGESALAAELIGMMQ